MECYAQILSTQRTKIEAEGYALMFQLLLVKSRLHTENLTTNSRDIFQVKTPNCYNGSREVNQEKRTTTSIFRVSSVKQGDATLSIHAKFFS